MIDPSSKMALRMTCLQQAQGDVKKAKELYDYLSEGMDSMPEYPVQKPTIMQQVGSLFGWVKENQNDIVQAVNFIQSVRGAQPIGMPIPSVPPAEIPPLPQP